VAITTLRASGPAEPDLAWRRYAEPARWADWAPQIRRVETAADRIAPGVTGRVVGPCGVAVAFTVDRVDEAARRWAWTVRLGLLRLQLEHEVTATDGGSATVLRIAGPRPVTLAYAPVAALALRRLVR
jgi:hypothetical protein